MLNGLVAIHVDSLRLCCLAFSLDCTDVSRYSSSHRLWSHLVNLRNSLDYRGISLLSQRSVQVIG